MVTTCPDVEHLFVVPATIDLAGAEIELVSVVAREQRLHKALHADPPDQHQTVEEAGEDRYDFVFIDCPPSLGLLTINALVAGQEMLIPIQAEYYALEGLGQLLSTVDMVRAHLNPDLAISAILVTMYDARTRLAAGVADEVRAHFGDQVLKTYIPRSVRVSEAPSYSQTVMTYDPGSPGAMSYLDAARELAEKGLRPQEGPPVNAPRTQRRGLGRGLGSLIPTTAPPARSRHRPDAARDGRPRPAGAGPGRGRVLRRAADRRDPAQRRPAAPGLRRGGDGRAGALHPRGRAAAARRRAPHRRRTPTSWSWGSGAGGPPRRPGSRTIPAIIRDTDDTAMLRDALLENLHRSQLNPLEEASAYQQLLEDFGCTHEELAARIGRSRPQISNTIRLLKLGPAVQRRVAAGVLSAGHARSLLAVEDPERPGPAGHARDRRGHQRARPRGDRRGRRRPGRRRRAG